MAENAPRARYRVVTLTLLLVGVAYLDRVCIAGAAPIIAQDLGLREVHMGFIFSAFTLSYGLFEIPAGWFADRFGARVALTRIVLWWSAMTAATGLCTGFASLLVTRLLFGMGEAGAFPAVARVYSRWLLPAEQGRAFGLAIMTGALSGAATQPLVVWLLSRVGWRGTFAMFGAVGLLWAAAWWTYFRDEPPQVGAKTAPSPAPARHGKIPWGAILRNRTLIALAAMYAGTIYGWYFYLTWLPTYLLKARGFDLKAAGGLSALPLLSIAVGVYVGGLLSDRLPLRTGTTRSRRIPGLIGLPLAAVATVSAVVTDSPMTCVACLSAAAGLAALGVAPAWAVCLEIGGEHAGVVTGTMNTFGNVGGTLSPVVVGVCVRSLGSWQVPLLTMAGCYAAAALCWLGVDPSRKIEARDPGSVTEGRAAA